MPIARKSCINAVYFCLVATAVFVNIVNSHSFLWIEMRCPYSRRRSHKNRKKNLKFKPKVNIIDDWTARMHTAHYFYYYFVHAVACWLWICTIAHQPCVDRCELRSLSARVRGIYVTYATDTLSHNKQFKETCRSFPASTTSIWFYYVRPSVRSRKG